MSARLLVDEGTNEIQRIVIARESLASHRA